ncbi:unnamed protein product, partial [Gulo gulo]
MGGQVSTLGTFQSLPCTTNADWMSALCPVLWDVPLHQLSIPGSHDTMTYCLNKTSPISQTQSRLLQLLGKVLPCVTRPVVLRWSTTQVLVSHGVTRVLPAARCPDPCEWGEWSGNWTPDPPSRHAQPAGPPQPSGEAQGVCSLGGGRGGRQALTAEEGG